jgi:hypothetical protein
MTLTVESRRQRVKAALFGAGLAGLPIVGLALLASSGGCEGEAKGPGIGISASRPLRVSLQISEGWLVSHDLYLTNTTGEDLTEVHLRVKVVGEDGAPTIQRYWERWPLGGRQSCTVAMSDVKNIQRVEITGRADQGRFDQTFRNGE